MFSKSRHRPKNETVLLTSLLLGILGATLSGTIIGKWGIIPEKGDLKSFVTTQTEYFEGKLSPTDTLFIGAQNRYQQYIDSITKNPAVFLWDVSKEDQGNKLFKLRSSLMKDTIFASFDSTLLKKSIEKYDSVFQEHLSSVSIKSHHFFNRHPQALAWILLISIAIGFSFAMIPVFLALTRFHNEELPSRTNRGNVIIAIFMILLLILPPLIQGLWNSPKVIIRPVDILATYGFGFKKWILYSAAIAPFAGAVFWLILVLTINSKISFLGENNVSNLSEKLISLRSEFENYFIVMALFLGYTIYCTSILIQVLNGFTYHANEYLVLPVEFSFVNGLAQTFFLVIIYLTINTNFLYIQRKILNVQEENKDSTKEVVLKGKKFTEYLKIILAILVPLIGSGIQELINNLL